MRISKSFAIELAAIGSAVLIVLLTASLAVRGVRGVEEIFSGLPELIFAPIWPGFLSIYPVVVAIVLLLGLIASSKIPRRWVRLCSMFFIIVAWIAVSIFTLSLFNV